MRFSYQKSLLLDFSNSSIKKSFQRINTTTAIEEQQSCKQSVMRSKLESIKDDEVSLEPVTIEYPANRRNQKIKSLFHRVKQQYGYLHHNIRGH